MMQFTRIRASNVTHAWLTATLSSVLISAFGPAHAGQAPELSSGELPAVVADERAPEKPQRFKDVVFQGNHVVPTSTLIAVAGSFLQRELDSAGIEQLRIALTKIYTDRGYINSGVLLEPQDTYQDGVLHFKAIEGHITQMRVQGLQRLSESYVEKRLVRSPAEVLNMNVLRERYQLLLDDPLFSYINARVAPGVDRGEATLSLDVARSRPYTLNVALNNYRPPSIGENAYDVSGQLRDLTGVGDTLDADIAGPLDGKGSPNFTLGWAFPVNHYGGTVGVRASYGRTVISEEPLADLDVRSNFERYELNASQPVIFTLAQKLSLTAGVARQRDSTSIAGQPFSLLPGADSGDLSEVVARFGPDYSFRSEHQYFGARLTVLYAHILNDLPSDVAYEQLTKNSFIFTLQALHLVTFASNRLELETRGLLQKTDADISALEALPVGGVDSVRGFRSNTLLLSNVGQFNANLRWRAIASNSGLRPAVSLGPFVDWARAHDVHDPATTLMSAGGSLRLTWPHVRFDFAGGAHIRSTSLIDRQHGSWQDRGIYAQLLYTL